MTSRRIRLGGFYRTLPLMAGEEKGFNADHDVHIEFGQVSSSTQQFQYLSDDRYDVVQTSPDNTANYRLNHHNPMGVRVDSQGFLGLDYGMLLVVVAKADVASVADLRGRTISVDAPDSGFAYVIYKILAIHGLERDHDYTVVSTGGVYHRYMAIMDQDADFSATLMSGGFETRAARRGFKLLSSVHEILDPYIGAWAAAKRQWLRSNRQLAVDFVSTYRKASRWVFDPANRDECVSMLERMPDTSPALASQLYEIQVRPGVGNIPDGAIDPKAVRNVLSLRMEFSGFEQSQDLDELAGPDTELFDLTYLKESTAGG